MTYPILLKRNKKQELLGLLGTVDRRRKYTLFIASCYFKTRSASTLIGDVVEHGFNIVAVHILIDKNEAVKIGKYKLISWLKRMQGKYPFEITLQVVDESRLFHVKTYGLLALNGDDQIDDGVLVSGSANLTGAGLTSTTGNYESFIHTATPEILHSFFHAFSELPRKNLDDIDTFKSADSFGFKYGLLQSGYFLHTWSNTLNKELSLKLNLSDQEKEKIKGDPALEELGFEIATASVSKSYLKFEYASPLTESHKQIKNNYTIETYWGHWVPKSIVDEIFGSEDFEQFKTALFNAVETQQDDIFAHIRHDYDRLREQRIIGTTQKHPCDTFLESIEKLRQSKTRLKRIYYQYEIMDLPYDFTQRKEIENLYDNFLETYKARKSNYTLRRVREAISTRCLEPLMQGIFEEE